MLVCALGRSIQRNRCIHAILDRERQLGIAPIDRTGTCIDQMVEIWLMPAKFEDRHMRDKIRIYIVERVFDRMAHTCLGCEMNRTRNTINRRSRLPVGRPV